MLLIAVILPIFLMNPHCQRKRQFQYLRHMAIQQMQNSYLDNWKRYILGASMVCIQARAKNVLTG